MSDDEALEHIRQIRLARRTHVKPVVIKPKKKSVIKASTITSSQALELLKLIEEGSL
jgi:hypothetical protein